MWKDISGNYNYVIRKKFENHLGILNSYQNRTSEHLHPHFLVKNTKKWVWYKISTGLDSYMDSDIDSKFKILGKNPK